MAKIPNPPQFERGETDDRRLYKHRQFVEEVIRTLRELNEEVTNIGGSSAVSSRAYPPQLGHSRI